MPPLSQELQDVFLLLLGLLASYVIWQLQRIQSRFENLLTSDHVHRAEFDALRTAHAQLSEQFFALKGEFNAHANKE